MRHRQSESWPAKPESVLTGDSRKRSSGAVGRWQMCRIVPVFQHSTIPFGPLAGGGGHECAKQRQFAAGGRSLKFEVSSVKCRRPSPGFPASHFAEQLCQTKPNLGRMGCLGREAGVLVAAPHTGSACRVGGSFGFTDVARPIKSVFSAKAEPTWLTARAAGPVI